MITNENYRDGNDKRLPFWKKTITMAPMNLKEKMLLQQWWKEWKQMAHYKEGKWLLRNSWAKGKKKLTICLLICLQAYHTFEVSTFAIEQILQSSNLWTIIQRKEKKRKEKPIIQV